MKTTSNLQRVLDSGAFAVTAEIGPPKSADPAVVRKHARNMKGYADAFNLTDNQTATVRLSSWAASLVCMQEGVEPVMQMACRDRNRIAIQSDILGASAMGVRNVLCITGDHQIFGNQREAKNVYDLDSVQELMVLRSMRDDAKTWGGDVLETPPQLYLGAVENPFGDPFEFRVPRLAKKIAAGAEFIQTQSIYDMERFETFMDGVRERGLDRKVHILAGVLPLKSVEGRPVHEEQGLGNERAGRGHRPDEERCRPEGGGHQAQRGDHRASQAGQGGPRGPHHGGVLGGEGAGNRAGGRSASPAGRPGAGKVNVPVRVPACHARLFLYEGRTSLL